MEDSPLYMNISQTTGSIPLTFQWFVVQIFLEIISVSSRISHTLVATAPHGDSEVDKKNGIVSVTHFLPNFILFNDVSNTLRSKVDKEMRRKLLPNILHA